MYPIIVGNGASRLAGYFNLHSAPTFLVIAPDGSVVKVEYGFTKASFKKMVKKYLTANR